MEHQTFCKRYELNGILVGSVVIRERTVASFGGSSNVGPQEVKVNSDVAALRAYDPRRVRRVCSVRCAEQRRVLRQRVARAVAALFSALALRLALAP